MSSSTGGSARPVLAAPRVAHALAAICLTLANPWSGLAAQSPAFRDVFVRLERPSDGARIDIDQGVVTIGVRDAVLVSSDSLGSLLRRNGIYPDAEAYAAVFRLNPMLRGAALKPGPILLPAVSGGRALRDALAGGYLASVTVDYSLKRRLAARAQSLGELVNALPDVPADRLGGPDAKLHVVGEARLVSNLADAIALALQDRTKPVDSLSLAPIDAQLALVEQMLRRLSAGELLTTRDRAVLSAISQAAVVRSVYWTEEYGGPAPMTPFPRVVVRVNAINTTRQPVPPLRVYYKEKAFYLLGDTIGDAFPIPTPNAEKELDIGAYMFWATQAGSTRRLTEVLPQTIESRRGGKVVEVVPVDLSFLRP